MRIFQLKEGYRYNSDSLFFYHFLSNLKINGEILEVGAGSGVIGLLLKRDFDEIELDLLDIQEKNIELMEKNRDENSLKCGVILADFSEFKSKKRYDFIISNPPFYHDGASKSENLHKNISRYSSNLELEDFIRNANSHLKPKGILAFCYDAKRVAEILYLLKLYKLNLTKIQFVYPKIGRSATLVMLEAKKSSKSLCDVLEPIFVFEGKNFSKKSSEIFKKAGLISIDLQ